VEQNTSEAYASSSNTNNSYYDIYAGGFITPAIHQQQQQ